MQMYLHTSEKGLQRIVAGGKGPYHVCVGGATGVSGFSSVASTSKVTWWFISHDEIQYLKDLVRQQGSSALTPFINFC